MDGNKEFDGDSVRKGVVLGLGIGLGVMGLIWTAIYARRELIKIVIAEQRERALEELAEEGEGMSQHFMNSDTDQLRAIEEGDDSGSLQSFEDDQSYEDLENNKVESESDFSLISVNSRDSKSQHCRTPPGKQMTNHRPWTPETVANELPILPKLINRYISPIISGGTVDLATDNGANAQMTNQSKIDLSRKKRHSSLPPLCDLEENFSFESVEDSYDAVPSISPSSPTRRATLQHTTYSHDNIQVALSESSNRPRASSVPIDENWLASIYETKVLSDHSLEADDANTTISFLTPVGKKNNAIGNRRRSNTDPTDKGPKHEAKGSKSVSPPQRKHNNRRQQSSQWTPSKKGLRKRHSFGSLPTHESHDASRNSRAPSPLFFQHKNGTSQEDQDDELSLSRTHSLPDPEFQRHGQGRQRSSSLQLFPTVDGNMVLDLSNNPGASDDDDGLPSREWFWIWA